MASGPGSPTAGSSPGVRLPDPQTGDRPSVDDPHPGMAAAEGPAGMAHGHHARSGEGGEPSPPAADIPAPPACRTCRQPVRATSRFCPACGAILTAEAAIQVRQRAVADELERWRQVKRVIIFYLCLLIPALTLLWVPAASMGTALLAVSGISAALTTA